MKKKLFALIATISLAFSTMGTAKAGGVYAGAASGTSILGARVGISNIVGVNVTYDYALARVWKGTFTIGGQVGYMWRGDSPSGMKKENDTIVSYSFKDKNRKDMLDFKIRTTYRFYVVVPEWEVYAGVGIGGGVALERTKQEHIYKEYKETFEEKNHYGFVSGSFILGTTYHFTRQIGVSLELNFGNFEQAWVNIGVNCSF